MAPPQGFMVGLVWGLAVSAGLHAALDTVDLVWRAGPLPVVLLAVLLVLFVVSLRGGADQPADEMAPRAWLVVGPAVLLWGLYAGNAAHAQASRRYLGSDALGWSVSIPAGSSVIEPGVTPATDIVLGPWQTFTEFEEECGLSRLWGGVHFRAAIEEGHNACRQVGDKAFDFLQRKLAGQ